MHDGKWYELSRSVRVRSGKRCYFNIEGKEMNVLVPQDEVEARLRPVRRSKRHRTEEPPLATAATKKTKMTTERKALSVLKKKTKPRKTTTATTVAASKAVSESVENSNEKSSSASSPAPTPVPSASTDSECADFATSTNADLDQSKAPKPGSPATKSSSDTACAANDLQASGLVCASRPLILSTGVLVS